VAERDAEITQLRAEMAKTAALREQVAQLQAQVADLAARVGQNSKNSSRPPRQTGRPSQCRSRCGTRPAADQAGADVPALTAVTTTAYHARGALAIGIAGKTWALPTVGGPFRGPQFQIPMPSRNQALQIQRLAPSG
jgi:hypothetical protein